MIEPSKHGITYTCFFVRLLPQEYEIIKYIVIMIDNATTVTATLNLSIFTPSRLTHIKIDDSSY